MYPERISKEAVQGLPLYKYDGPFEVIASDSQMELAYQHLSGFDVIGFDTETKPAFQKGQKFLPSLIQLAVADKVFVIQLKKLTQYDLLIELLSNSSILKVGIAIRDDILELKELFDFEANGFNEIAELTRKAGIIHTGLRNLCAIVFECRISKRAQLTDWSKNDLTDAQVLYAATDAWMSLKLYNHFAPRSVSD